MIRAAQAYGRYMPIFKAAIIAFCLFHMYAVTVYATPESAEGQVVRWMRRHRKDVRPYMLITSQWQLWNLFAPDPLRRVSSYVIDVGEDGRWIPEKTIDWQTLSLWRQSSELKMLRRLEDEHKLIRERYLYLVCKDLDLAPETPIRLRIRSYVVPDSGQHESVEWWRAWEPTWRDQEDVRTFCP